MRLRGQASAEILVLSLVSLSMLSISIFALSGIRAGAEGGIADAAFRMSSDSLAGAAREVCALGAGNLREVRTPGGLSIEAEPEGPGMVFRISGGPGRSKAYYSPCPIDAEETADSLLVIENKDGKIRIRGR